MLKIYKVLPTTPAEKITCFDSKLKQLAGKMLNTMLLNKGIGLAAPQVGHNIRMFVMHIGFPRVMLNPVITKTSGTTVSTEECLSYPGVRMEKTRAKQVWVEYQDLNGYSHHITADQITAICMQHEIDHLDGVQFTKNLSKPQPHK